MDFRIKRQLVIIGVLFAVILIPVVFSIYSWLPTASCQDNRRNQGEEGIDCGGPCTPCALKNPENLDVFWTRFVSVREGSYDAVAEVKNPNIKLGAEEFEYEFQFFDDADILVARRVGRSFMFPAETAHFVESNIMTGRTISRVLFAVRDVRWAFTNRVPPDVAVGDRKLTVSAEKQETTLTATLLNRSLRDLKEVAVSAFVFDRQENVLAVSKTVEKDLLAGSERQIFFSWPRVIQQEDVFITFEPRVNILEGSQ